MSANRSYLVSVVVPAYNSASYITVAMRSLLAQSMPLEVIVVDDGSTDATAAIIELMCSQHSNMRLISVENGGAGRARNIGIQNATGDYVAFLDSDDVFFLNAFNEVTGNQIRQWLADKVDIVMTPFVRTDMALLAKPIEGLPETLPRIRHHMPRLAFWTCLYRRDFLLNEEVAFPEYSSQDVETAFRYRAFSRAQRVVSQRVWRFVLQRDNLQSNTHTWNEEVLFSIKAQVYDDLYNEALTRTACHEDLAYLESIRVSMLSQYFCLIERMGTTLNNGLETYQKMFELAGKRPFCRNKLHTLGGIRARWAYRRDCKVVKKALAAGLSEKLNKAYATHEIVKGSDSIQEYNVDEIMHRLKKLSKDYGSAL